MAVTTRCDRSEPDTNSESGLHEPDFSQVQRNLLILTFVVCKQLSQFFGSFHGGLPEGMLIMHDRGLTLEREFVMYPE